jgi:hypothetical protein
LKKTTNFSKKIRKCSKIVVIIAAQTSSKITNTAPCFSLIVPIILGFKISKILNKIIPTKI